MKNTILKRVLFLFFLLLSITAFSQQKKYISYTVKKGETIKKIAKRYNLSTRDLLRLNPGVRRRPKPNTVIIVPNLNFKETETVLTKDRKELEVTPTTNTVSTYKVLPKDTLYGISKKYNITIDELLKANPELANGLKPNMELKIPPASQSVVAEIDTDKFEVHTVAKGDTVYNITKRYNISVHDFYTLNPKALNGLPIGMVVKVKEKKIEEILTEDIPQTDIEEEPQQANSVFVENINLQKSLKIAIMLPYQLQKHNTTADFKKDVLLNVATDFHLGTAMAIDSLRQKGIPVEVTYFDTQNTRSKINRIIAENDFSSYDAVIGPLFFDKAHYLASKIQVPVIAPMYSEKQNSLSRKSNLIRLGVGPKEEEKVLLSYLEKKYNGENILVISDAKPKNQSLLWRTVNKLKQFDSIQNIAVIKPKKGYIDIKKIKEKLKKDTNNWVLLLSDDNVTTSAGVNNLKALVTDFNLKLFAFNKGDNFNKIDHSILGSLQFVYPTTNCLLSYTNEVKRFIKKYKTKNNALPTEYAFRGFDVTYDMLVRLASSDNGLGLNLGKSTRLNSIFNYNKRFLGGYENKGVFLVEYNAELKPVVLETLEEEKE